MAKRSRSRHVPHSSRRLVVYYATDATRAIAEAISAATGADLLELQTRRPYPRPAPVGYLLGRLQALLGVRPELQPLGRNLADYDLIYIGTPVWAGTCAPALRSLLAQTPLHGKKVALFCAGKGWALPALRKLAARCTVLGELRQPRPAKDPEANGKAARLWACEMVAACGRPQPASRGGQASRRAMAA